MNGHTPVADVEAQPNDLGALREGYPRLSALMGCAPETAIFRRFGAISAQVLLHQQAEIHELEIALKNYQREDKESGHQDRIRYDVDFDVLRRSGGEDPPEGNDSAQWDTMVELRAKLREYEEGLLRHRQLLELGRPPKRQVKSLREWMTRPSQGNVFLVGSDHNIWKDPELEEDLVGLAAKLEEESFSNSATVWLAQEYHRYIGRHIHKPEEEIGPLSNTIRYTNPGTFRVFKTISTIVASLLPVAGIAILSTIQDMQWRIAVIAVLIALFSFSLSKFTSATPKDVFIAATTFAAVLVVFVGTTGAAEFRTCSTRDATSTLR